MYIYTPTDQTDCCSVGVFKKIMSSVTKNRNISTNIYPILKINYLKFKRHFISPIYLYKY